MIFRKPYRVVVIDDDEAMLELIKVYLSQVSHELITYSLFKSASDAMAFIENHLVHIVITDIHLEDGDQDGGDIITRCLKLEKGIQIVAITEDPSLLTAINCYNRGARYILPKPFTKKQFREHLDSLFIFFEQWHELIKDKLNPQERADED